jgi:hypothetical protein
VAILVLAAGGCTPGGVRVVERAAPARATAWSYGWPVEPFFEQHPVRGLFGDPRIGPGSDGRMQHNFHFGVDVPAPDGTPVYATLTGRVSIHPLHPDTVLVSDGSGRVFEYWHVVPTMRSGRAVAYRTVIGHVEKPWAHVHFSERVGSTYLNPLRAGAMGPYEDTDRPELVSVTFERAGRDAGTLVDGTVDVVVEAYDRPALPVPAPWDRVRLTPALVRWRVRWPGPTSSAPWRVASDVRVALPSAPYDAVFAVGTRQNRTYRVGRYRLYLARGWSTGALANGSYLLDVAVSDIRGHTAGTEVPFVVANL